MYFDQATYADGMLAAMNNVSEAAQSDREALDMHKVVLYVRQNVTLLRLRTVMLRKYARSLISKPLPCQRSFFRR